MSTYKKITGKINVIVFLLMFFLVGCDSEQKSTSKYIDERLSNEELYEAQNKSNINKVTNEWLFGFDLRSSAQEDAKQYLPFLNYLSNKTGYKFKLRFTPEDGKIVDDLGKGLIHFAAIGAVSYIQASDKYDVQPVARGLNNEGKAEYRAMIVVNKTSKIRNLAGLKGKKLAFGSKTSTQGHLIPRILLSKSNIYLTDLHSYEYTGSHQKCADAVISGRFDACGLQDTMAKELVKLGKVRVIAQSDYFPSSGVAANKNIPNHVLLSIKKAILDFRPTGRDAPNLYNWNKTEMPKGFAPAKKGDYQPLHEWLIKLELINPDTSSENKG